MGLMLFRQIPLKQPIRTLHPLYTTFWLDDFGIHAWNSFIKQKFKIVTHQFLVSCCTIIDRNENILLCWSKQHNIDSFKTQFKIKFDRQSREHLDAGMDYRKNQKDQMAGYNIFFLKTCISIFNKTIDLIIFLILKSYFWSFIL
jgi:hypothetical protein